MRYRWPLFVALAVASIARADDPVTSDWSFHAQSTAIEQWHYSFPSPYEGQNSFEGQTTEDKHTLTATLFLGRRLWEGASVYYDPEVPQGTGLSGTVGVAGFPNGEGTRAAGDEYKYNTARLFIRQVVGLGGEREKIDDNQNQIADEEYVHRLTLTAGKLSATDIFDDNAYSHDPRTQFLNWSLMDSAAWDYPADSRGYTGGVTAELNEKSGALHYGFFMEPSEANGLRLDPHVDEAWAQVLQFDLRYSCNGQTGAVRPFIFWNHAHMGDYSDALTNPSAHLDITRTREYRSKSGAGLSWDQQVSANVGAFARLSWNDGKTESWAFTEIDRSLALGASFDGSAWGRKDDVAGLAGVMDGLSSEHRAYLAAGGYGFIIGDGKLNYAPEEILEAYYALRLFTWLTVSPDVQYIEHPAYNRDRGPVPVYAVRAHIEF